MVRNKFIIAAFLVLAAGAALSYIISSKDDKPSNLIMLYGNVDVRQVDISFRVPGRVENLLFQEGDKVKAGDLMASLEKNPYQEELDQASANLEAIAIDLENADMIFQRRQALVTDLAVSEEECENALTRRNQLIANLFFAQGAVSIAKDQLSYTDVYAPSDGIVLSRVREKGSVVNPTEPVYTLSVSDPVWIRAFVNEPELGDVYYGMEARVYTDRASSKVYKGKVGFISPVAEFTPKTVQTTSLRTDLVYRLRVYIDEPDQHLVQGMPVTVELVKNSSQ
ncbi:MAG: efflux RND transporter periplasmic adaptor subunit [Chlamydiae bacterium]|nr:efflux RND transporter periplasmic adaptor subunit [Chlamydiota bacterium]